MKTSTYKVYYFSQYAARWDETPWLEFVEAPADATKDDIEKICKEKIPDFIKMDHYEKVS